MEVNVENKVKQTSCYLCIQNKTYLLQVCLFQEFRDIDHQNKDVGLILICLLSILQDRLMLNNNTCSMQVVMFICLGHVLE